MKYRIAIVRPFYNGIKGKFLPYFQFFLNSCKANPEFDWFIFTDNEESYVYPDNVHKINMTFEECQKLIYSKFDFPVIAQGPMKLHDYKPAFGYIFSEWLKEYDFWGYTDYDIIYGKLTDFISDEMLDSYDKLFRMGHFSLYRNDEESNLLFMREVDGKTPFMNAATSEKNFNFDDDWNGIFNIYNIFEANGKRIYSNPENEKKIADIYTKKTDFRIVHQRRGEWKNIIEPKQNAYFAFTNGKLVRLYANGSTEEYMYLHLHNRKMIVPDASEKTTDFLIVPNRFIVIDGAVTIEKALKFKTKYKEAFSNYFRLRWSNLKTKFKRIAHR